MKSWIPEGDNYIYAKDQEVQALKGYEHLKFIHKEIQQLGYPSKFSVYHWYERRKTRPEVKY